MIKGEYYSRYILATTEVEGIVQTHRPTGPTVYIADNKVHITIDPIDEKAKKRLTEEIEKAGKKDPLLRSVSPAICRDKLYIKPQKGRYTLDKYKEDVESDQDSLADALNIDVTHDTIEVFSPNQEIVDLTIIEDKKLIEELLQ